VTGFAAPLTSRLPSQIATGSRAHTLVRTGMPLADVEALGAVVVWFTCEVARPPLPIKYQESPRAE
jgi:hypothetical protein